MIVGRTEETKLLESTFKSNKAEFCALYGRRRIGKTFLIREFFKNKKESTYFEVTGIKDGSLADQLKHFTDKLSLVFYNGAPLKTPHSWEEAFTSLTEAIHKSNQKKVIIFLDELPWLATRRGKLIQALDYFWNTQWVKIKEIKLIACGSAASWILNNLINAKGGLHNRLTQILLLKPFDLKTTKDFFSALGMQFSNKQVLDIYMITGGVPFYLEQVKKSKSITQNINALCFSENSPLREEFPRLFKSLFKNSQLHLKIMRIISTRRYGLSRDDLLSEINIKTGGWINDRLDELEAAGFIKTFTPYGKTKTVYYKVIDEYSLFYLRWIEPTLKTGHDSPKNYWHNLSKTPSWIAWSGYAFENICEKHAEQIRKALEIDKINSLAYHWRYIPSKHSQKTGAEIDLLFDRDDNAITLCEIKYSNEEFVVDKEYAKKLLNKMEVFESVTKTKKQLMLAIITTIGVKPNIYSEDLVQQAVCLNDLCI